MTLKSHARLLLTGAAVGLGQALRPRLKANCDVLRLSDRVEFGVLLALVTYVPALCMWLPRAMGL